MSEVVNIWAERYRPKTIDDVILPKNIKDIFKSYIETDSHPNLILSGKSGVGKTTVAKAMLEEMNADCMTINGSLDSGIDVLRHDIKTFASSQSFGGGRKYVLIDEADYLNSSSTQPALRKFMEDFAQNCGFIFTCNYVNRIIPELKSRCSVIDFNLSGSEKKKTMAKMFKRATQILDDEGVDYNQKAVAEVVKKFFPDFRKTLNELQKYSITGKIDEGILSNVLDSNIETLIDHMKEKNFTEVRKWVAQNNDVETHVLFRHFYENAAKLMKPQTIPAVVVLLGEYQYKDCFVADKEINTSACLVEIMAEAEWL